MASRVFFIIIQPDGAIFQTKTITSNAFSYESLFGYQKGLKSINTHEIVNKFRFRLSILDYFTKGCTLQFGGTGRLTLHRHIIIFMITFLAIKIKINK